VSELDDRDRRRVYGRRPVRRRRLLILVVVPLAVAAGIAAIGVALATDREPEASRALEPGAVGSNEASDVGSAMKEPSRPATAVVTRSLQHVRGKVIAIDPGHNGRNYLHGSEINRLVDAGTLWKACDTTGTATNDGYTEAAYTFDVSRRLAQILRRAGGRVVLTRSDNRGWGPCITERAAIGNRARADVAISIHADGGPASGRGFHVIYAPSIQELTDDIASDSRRLAIAIRWAFRQTGMPEATYVGQQGLNVRSDLGGLNLSDVPKVLFETGNMRNSVDAALLKSAAFRQRAAVAIARGLDVFLAHG
jgi:N-acetylmuramoyl-L-alanine amidase